MANNGSKSSRADAEVELHFLEAVVQRVPEDYESLKALAELYTQVGRHEEGLAIDLKMTRIEPLSPLAWYNYGCSLALVGRHDESVEALAKAVELGYDDYDWMKRDQDLHSLHGDPRFESLLSWIYAGDAEDFADDSDLPF